MKRIILLLLCATLCHATSVTIAESTYADASGRLATGTITISWPSFSNGVSNIAAGSTTVVVTAGVMSVSLVANDTADPPMKYTASFRLQTASYSQQWVVPTVAGPLTIQGVTWSSNSPVTIGLDQLRRAGHSAGDIAYYDGILWKRLARGTNGQVLSIDTSLSGYLKWVTGGGGGGIALTDLSATTPIVYNNSTGAFTHANSAATIIDCGDTTHSCRLSFDSKGHVSAIANDSIAGVGTGLTSPGTSLDRAVLLCSGTSCTAARNSLVTIDASGNIVTPGTISAGDGTVAGGPKMYEVSSNGNNFRQWLVPDLLTADLVLKFADALPTAGQVMRFGAPSSTISAQTWGDASGVGACSANNWASTLNNNAAPTCTQPGFSNLSGTASTAQLAANAVTSAKMAVVNTRRTACIPVGGDDQSALTDPQLGPQSRQYLINAAQTLVEITVAANAGTPNIILGRNRAGTIVNLTSTALATAASGGPACSKGTAVTGLDGATTCSATLQNTALNAGDWITLVSGTAGGTAKEMTACFTTTVD